MISIAEAQDLMKDFIFLRKTYEDSKTNSDLKYLKAHERICIDKFRYLISMRADKYKNFQNYDDLYQEGLEALIKSMKTYDPNKGIFFYWAHKYIETRIARSANLHTTIRYPLKYAKINKPHKEAVLPILIEGRFCPDKNLECFETFKAIQSAMDYLNKNQKDVISLAFGFDGDKPLSVNKICKKMNISRISCVKTINNALDIIKSNIQL